MKQSHICMEPAPGDVMPDGSIYLGVLGDVRWYVASEDIKDVAGNRRLLDIGEAKWAAEKARMHGHDDWTLPLMDCDSDTPDILHEMRKNMSVGAFSGTYGADCYWGDAFNHLPTRREMSSGKHFPGGINTSIKGALRCVRSVPAYKPCEKPGDRAQDGSIYLGLYNGRYWYVTAEDDNKKGFGRLEKKFNDAAQYAKELRAHGHDDWMLPPGDKDPSGEPNILKEMYKMRCTGAFRNTYDEQSFHSYWSSAPVAAVEGAVWVQRFSDGNGGYFPKEYLGFTRCVRAVKPPCRGALWLEMIVSTTEGSASVDVSPS